MPAFSESCLGLTGALSLSNVGSQLPMDSWVKIVGLGPNAGCFPSCLDLPLGVPLARDLKRKAAGGLVNLVFG